jgi:hypothetical protein
VARVAEAAAAAAAVAGPVTPDAAAPAPLLPVGEAMPSQVTQGAAPGEPVPAAPPEKPS